MALKNLLYCLTAIVLICLIVFGFYKVYAQSSTILSTDPYVSNVTDSSAVVSGQSTSLGVTELGIQYGTDTSYGKSTVSSSEHQTPILNRIGNEIYSLFRENTVVYKDDKIYFLNRLTSTVTVYDSNDLTQISQWSTTVAGQPQHEFPRSIAISSTNEILVGYQNGGRINKFDVSGNFISGFSAPWSIVDLAIDDSNNIVVVTTSAIYKYSYAGSSLSNWSAPPAETSGWGSNNFIGAALDSSGSIYASTYPDNKIFKYDNSGNYLLDFSVEGQRVFRLAVDAEDNIYIAAENQVVQYTSNGQEVRGYSFASVSDPWIYGLALNEDLGILYITDNYGGVVVNNGTEVEIELAGLECNTTYHFRIYAVYSAGTVYGDDQTFTTSAGENCSNTLPPGSSTPDDVSFDSSKTKELIKTGVTATVSLLSLLIVAATIYTYTDYLKHKKVLMTVAKQSVKYTYWQHLHYVSLPLARYRVSIQLDRKNAS